MLKLSNSIEYVSTDDIELFCVFCNVTVKLRMENDSKLKRLIVCFFIAKGCSFFFKM